MQILLIEDDPSIVNFLKPLLKGENYDLLHAETISEAEVYLRTHPVELILLDLGLPDKDGMLFLKEFREKNSTPIIVISARADEKTKVQALDLDADDYLTKPFGSNELLARIRTVNRHFKKNTLEKETTFLVNGSLFLDIEKREVRIEDDKIHLTKNEFLLLKIMMENIGKVLTHEFLVKSVWGLGSMNSLTLRVNMSNLRKKIEKKPVDPIYIQTEIGVGYRMAEVFSN